MKKFTVVVAGRDFNKTYHVWANDIEEAMSKTSDWAMEKGLDFFDVVSVFAGHRKDLVEDTEVVED